MGLGTYENELDRNCSVVVLGYHLACLNVLTKENVTFLSQYEECQGCKLLKTKHFVINGSLVLKTLSPLRYAVLNGTEHLICNGTYQFSEFGRYELDVANVTRGTCLPRMTAEPDAATLPIPTTVVVLLAMATFWYLIKGVGKRMAAGRFIANYFNRGTDRGRKHAGTRALEVIAQPQAQPSRSRLRSLDTFRGLCIALMVFIHAGGGGYAIFSHSTWDGLTVADVLFPCFAFAMGEALVLSLHARLKRGLPRTTAFYQVTRRALVISLIGIVINSANKSSWKYVRLPGVWQRLAAMYLLVGAVECVTHTTTTNITPGHSLFRDIAAGWKQWLVTLTLVAIQVCVSLLVAAPGCPRGYSGPGGRHMSETLGDKLKNCTGGIAGYIDRVVLGPSHLNMYGFPYPGVYVTVVPHDPHGLLGTISGTLVVQAGAHAARVVLAYNNARARITRWVLWSVVMGVVGGALAGFSHSGGVIPLNPFLWSVSYCLVTSSTAMFIQAALYFVVDLKNKWGGQPLYYAGQNALFLCIASDISNLLFPLFFHRPYRTHAGLLASSTAAMLFWLAVGVVLYKKRVFFSL